jgi:DNA-binding IclR family transcriptional regulator
MSLNNQESTVLIALTRESFPRTLDALVAETGYPRPSLRRCLGQLRVKGYDIIRNGATGEYANLGRASSGEAFDSATMG